MKDRISRTARENRIEITLAEACYFGFFILLSITKGLGLYEGQKLFELLVFPALLCGAVKLFITPYTRRQWLVQIFLIILTAVVFYESHERGVFFISLMVLGMKNMSVRKVFHVGLWVWSLCAVALSVFSFFRLEHTVYRVHAKMGLGHIFRWSLGFSHPNILHITYLALCAFLIYELGDRYKFRHFVCLMAGNVLVFFYSISYTGMGIVTVLLVGGLYVRIRPKFCIVEKILVNLVLPVCLILSFVLPFYLTRHKISGWVQRLNFMLNTRIWLAKRFLKPKYRSLFGADISEVVKSSMTMDNSYVWGYINYGLVLFGIIILGYFALMFYDTHKQRTRELVILICFLGAGWTEPLLFNTSFKNVTLIFLGNLLFLQKEGEKEYCLFPHLPETVEIPLAGLPDRLFTAAGDVWRKRRLKIVVTMAVGAVLGGLLCLALYREPAGYIVPRNYTDGLDEHSVYLTREEDGAYVCWKESSSVEDVFILPQGAGGSYAGWRVMNYVDAETPMQLIQGNAVRLETYRYCLGSLLIGGLCGGMFGIVWFAIREGDECRRRESGEKDTILENGEKDG